MSDFGGFLTDRGLTTGRADLSQPALPEDYEARVRALELALQWRVVDSGTDPQAERTMARAIDFLSFLTARNISDA